MLDRSVFNVRPLRRTKKALFGPCCGRCDDRHVRERAQELTSWQREVMTQEPWSDEKQRTEAASLEDSVMSKKEKVSVNR